MTFPVDMALARRYTEASMVSTCTVTRDGDGDPVWDNEAGTYTDPQRVTVYEGKCRIRPAATWGRTVEAGEASVILSAFQVQLPFAVTGVREGHRLKVDSSPDAALVGRSLVVRFVPDMGDHITARRLICESA